MAAEIKLFSDVIDAIKKVAELAVGLKNIPAKKRKLLLDAVSEAYMLLNSSINLVYHRLGDALLLENDKKFLKDVRAMSNFKAWNKVERDMRMCAALRRSHVQIDHLSMTAPDLILGGRDWKNIRTLVDQILEREGELADYICSALGEFSRQADGCKDDSDIKKLRRKIRRAASKLAKDRRKLMKDEIAFTEKIV